MTCLSMLARVPDPRDPRGVRYRLEGLLAVAVSAVVAGARSFAAIGEWAADLPAGWLAALGLNSAPGTSNLRKLFARIDPVAFDRQIGSWMWTRVRAIGDRRVIAIDGKTVRGARTAVSSAPHLVGALDHARGSCWVRPLSQRSRTRSPRCVICLPGSTRNTLSQRLSPWTRCTQTDTAAAITAAGADYVFTVKANQPGLHHTLKRMPRTKCCRRATVLATGLLVADAIVRVGGLGRPCHPNAAASRRPIGGAQG